jgi:hypothetical protein
MEHGCTLNAGCTGQQIGDSAKHTSSTRHVQPLTRCLRCSPCPSMRFTWCMAEG